MSSIKAVSSPCGVDVDESGGDKKKALNKFIANEYYSVTKKSNEEIVKTTGQIDGNTFEISDCVSCTISIMDVTDQVVIENLSSCTIFIGACSSTVFIRKCVKCEFHIVARQLRINTSHKSVFFSFSQSQIHVEESTGLLFAPFNGGYEFQAIHIAEADLDITKNLWQDVYDHSDPSNINQNWHLLPVTEYGEPYFPDGSSTQVIPISLGQTESTKPSTSGQVGQSFGIDQMIHDSKKTNNAASSYPSSIDSFTNEGDGLKATLDILNKFPDEVALLVAVAGEKGFDAKSTFRPSNLSDNNAIEIDEFVRILSQLATQVGEGEDLSTRQDLDKALSEQSIGVIIETCRGFTQSKLDIAIDVPYFLRLCEKKYKMLLGDEDISVLGDFSEEIVTETAIYEFDENASNRESLSEDIDIKLKFSQTAFHMSDINSLEEASEEDADGYIQNIRKVSSSSSRPQSAPAGKKSNAMIMSATNEKESTELPLRINIASPSRTRTAAARASVIPRSPYDEEIAFNVEDGEEDVDTIAYHKHQALSSPAKSEEKKQKAVATVTKHLVKQRPKSAEPSRRKSPAMRRESAERRPSLSSLRLSVKDGASSSSSTGDLNITYMYDVIEDLLRDTVRQADLFHKIQVHLGFIKSYTIVPPRGPIIQSKPKEWLTVRDIQTALLAAQLRFNDFQIKAVMNLTERYANAVNAADIRFICDMPKAVRGGGGTTGASDQRVNLIHPLWFKQYLMNLRLTKRTTKLSTSPQRVVASDLLDSSFHSQSIVKENVRDTSGLGSPSKYGLARQPNPQPWEIWLGKKIIENKSKQDTKPKEFRRALAGMQHNMCREDMEKMIEHFDIIPSDWLLKEIDHRVKCWVNDVNGRREFRHQLHMEIRKWEVDNKEKKVYRKLSSEEQKAVTSEIYEKLKLRKREDLKSSERVHQVITKDMYWKYDKVCREKNYQGTIKWGKWLNSYRDQADKKLGQFLLDVVDRKKRVAAISHRKEAVAPMLDLEDAIQEAAKGLPVNKSIELKKSLISLKKSKSIADAGTAKSQGKLVTRAEFDYYLQDVLAPMWNDALPYEIKHLAEEARKSHDHMLQSTSGPGLKSTTSQRNSHRELFCNDKLAAAERVVEVESKKQEKHAKEFNKWKKEKVTLLKEEAEKKKQLEAKQKADEELRRKKADKAFKQWETLRRKNSYISKADGTRHVLPSNGHIVHKSSWNQESDLTRYYAQMEKKF